MIVAAVAMAAALQLGDFRRDPALRHLQSLPRDVRVHIDRRLNCSHWAGEEPYDADRRREIETALSQLRCERLDRDDRALRRRYLHAPAILKVLNHYRDA